jgi:hypothetical protein
LNNATSFPVNSEESAGKALDYFNGFHDGFIRRIVLESRDRIQEDFSQSCSGVFDLKMDLSHYNYRRGAEPFHAFSQIVRAEFRNVQGILLDLGEGFLGNTILSLTITAGSRRRGGESSREPCLSLHLARHYYLEQERRHELREAALFTFTDATFSEE